MKTTRLLQQAVITITAVALCSCGRLTTWQRECGSLALRADRLINDNLPPGWRVTKVIDNPDLYSLINHACYTAVDFKDTSNKDNDGSLSVYSFSDSQKAEEEYQKTVITQSDEFCYAQTPVEWDNDVADQYFIAICERQYGYRENKKRLDYQALYGDKKIGVVIFYMSDTTSINELKALISDVDKRTAEYLP